MLNVIVTIDYEIFGNGRGDVRRHMTMPLSKMLDIFNHYSVPVTIMFEVIEYMKFREYDSKILRDKGYSWASEIEKQVFSAYDNGHDIQLHIHPQWYTAVYKNGHWKLDNPYVSPADLPFERIDALINVGKERLENLVRCVDNNYKCNVLRLTNLNWREPPLQVVKAMHKNKIPVHSLCAASYGPATPRGYWVLDESKNIIEIPIYSKVMPLYKCVTPLRILAGLKLLLSNECFEIRIHPKNGNRKRQCIYVPRSLRKPYVAKWDLCKLTSNKLIQFLFDAVYKYDAQKQEVPLVMIGHTKDFLYSRYLRIFLEEATKLNHIRFITFTTFVNKFLGYE